MRMVRHTLLCQLYIDLPALQMNGQNRNKHPVLYRRIMDDQYDVLYSSPYEVNASQYQEFLQHEKAQCLSI